MRLSDVLSKPINKEFVQVDGFLIDKKGKPGQKVELSVGNICLNFNCHKCNDLRTFSSEGKLIAIFCSKRLISIDCLLSCNCGTTIQVWYLIEAETDITSPAPKVRIMKRAERLPEEVSYDNSKYGYFSQLLNLADRAYMNLLGAGSIIYLRKIFETITKQTADLMHIPYEARENGNPKVFSKLLEDVDKECKIIPIEFSENGYRLFKELSNVIHGNCDEEQCLKKYQPLHRLIVGILDNVKNKEEFKQASSQLGWNELGEENE